MQLPDPTSSPWADKILNGIVGGSIFAFIIGFLKLIFYRNKPQADVAEIDARTDGQKADTAIKLSNQLVTLHDRMNLMEASIDTNQRETAAAVRFYREQMEMLERKAQYADKLDMTYRNRSHELNGELGRLVLAVTTLQLEYFEKTGEKAAPIEIRTYDEIVKMYPLPEPPE